MTHRFRKAAACIALAGAGLALAACSSIQPSIGQYGVVTAHGAFSGSQGISEVADPGQKLYASGTDWYLPADVRNYVTAPTGGDRSNPQAEITGSTSSEDGMPVYTWTYVAFELNPNHNAIKAFFPFCLKYACASTTAQNDDSNSSLAHSATPGWNNMLAEIMPRAIDDATRAAVVNFGPNLWTDRAEWPSYQAMITQALPAQLEQLTGATTQYFCGPGSTTARCLPPLVVVNNVTPVSSSVVNAYNQSLAAQYALAADRARLKAAQGIYGADANYFLGLEDLAAQCPHCNIFVGNPPAALTGK